MAQPGSIPDKLSLTVVTRERKLLEAEVDEVVLPASDGQMGILPGHTPLLATLRIGGLMYRQGNERHQMVLRWGFAEVLPNRVIVLAEGAYSSDEIDLEEAERQRIEAERELASLASHDEGFALAEAKLEESFAMIQIARRKTD
ncbi:MAG TPA: ATP synthase F1 subunit epsilon [Thermoanaerobaculia bacterium]|nr:ATP synthase F1 subunit epsilon [Thermoanaerobaculia bacterium]